MYVCMFVLSTLIKSNIKHHQTRSLIKFLEYNAWLTGKESTVLPDFISIVTKFDYVIFFTLQTWYF